MAVPGEVAGYWMAHQRYGVLAWSELFQPSIKLAEEGYTVTRALATAINARRFDIMGDSNLRYALLFRTLGGDKHVTLILTGRLKL